MSKRRRSPTKPVHERDPKRVAAGKKSKGQSKGGRMRALVLGPEGCSAVASLGGRTAQANARRRREAERRKLAEAHPHIKPDKTKRRVRPSMTPATRTSVVKFLDARDRYKTERLNAAS